MNSRLFTVFIHLLRKGGTCRAITFLHILTDSIRSELDAVLHRRMAVKDELNDLIRRFIGEIKFRQLLHTRDKSKRIASNIKRVQIRLGLQAPGKIVHNRQYKQRQCGHQQGEQWKVRNVRYAVQAEPSRQWRGLTVSRVKHDERENRFERHP